MTIVELMEQFSNPDLIKTLDFNDKLTGIGITVVLGMGITVIALVIVLLTIVLMTKILTTKSNKKNNIIDNKTQKNSVTSDDNKVEDLTDDLELVAVITASIASSLNTSTNKLVIKKITKSIETSPIWSRAGIIDQMNNRF